MKTNIKKILKASALATVIASAFFIGNYQGQQQGYKKGKSHIINDAIIYDENHQEQNYFLEVDGQAYSYWFENENIQSIATKNKDKELYIKDQKNYIICSCDYSNIPKDLQKAKVTSYMNACDNDNALIIFIEE